jgi:hypothetical protein
MREVNFGDLKMQGQSLKKHWVFKDCSRLPPVPAEMMGMWMGLCLRRDRDFCEGKAGILVGLRWGLRWGQKWKKYKSKTQG